MQLTQGAAWLDPELVHEGSSRLLVGVEGFALTPTAVQREHELTAQPLAQGLLRDQGLELTDEVGVPAEREVGLDPLFERNDPALLEPGDLGLREGLEGEIGERRPAPERERLTQEVGGLLRVTAGVRTSPFVEQPLEAIEVDAAGLEPERVAGAFCHEEAVCERAPQL